MKVLFNIVTVRIISLTNQAKDSKFVLEDSSKRLRTKAKDNNTAES